MSSTVLKKILLRAMLVVVLCGLGYGLARLPALVVGRTLRQEKAPSTPAGQDHGPAPPADERPQPPEPDTLSERADGADAARDGAPANEERRDNVYEALKSVMDPEIRLSVVDLGLIRRIDRNADGSITVTMTLTSPLCPYLKQLVAGIREAVQPFAAGRKVQVEIDFSRPWSPADLSPEGRRKLFGATP